MPTTGHKLRFRPEWMAARVKHGAYRDGKESPTHYIWRTMIVRCRKDPRYSGIEVCERWKQFENFLADMGERPTPQHTIDRIDNRWHYEPDNCRWATAHQQNRNRRDNVWIEYQGKVMVAADWAKELGISQQAMNYRIKNWGNPCVPRKD